MRRLWGSSALAAAIGIGAATGAASVQTAEDRQYAEAEEHVTVTATRTPQDRFSVPSVVSVIDAEEIAENLVTDIKDLVRFEPGVSVPTSPSRFTAAQIATGRDGNSGFNIRGLGGDRVLFQVDGVRVPDGFSFGPASFGRGDYFDLDLLQSVEILRGPGSALYGSDGLAGVVSFITKDPSDFLHDDEQFAARGRVSYSSADDSLAIGVSAAGRWGDWSTILAYTHREGHETESQGDNDVDGALRTSPNPQDTESDAAMARLVFQPVEAHRFRLTADYGQREVVTDALSARTATVFDSFFPALRYDTYELTPKIDDLYVLPEVGAQSDSRITPRLGVVAWPTEEFGVFFNYAQGFKAPAPSQVNNAFTNIDSGYTSVPNPDLKPEPSESAEVGIRFRNMSVAGGDVRASASVFSASYEDFITQVMFGNFGDPAIFQFVNLGEVEIWGAEGRADLNWENGFGLTIAASYAEGDQNDPLTGHVPLDTIDPFKLVAGLSYNDPNGRFGGQFIVTHVVSKDEDDVASATAFRPDGFTILDLTAYWNVTDAATLRVGLFNAADETYWWWNDARGLSATSATLNAYTQPGRNFSASISYWF